MLRESPRRMRRSAALMVALALPATAALAAPALAAPPAPTGYWPIPEDQIGVVLYTARAQMAEDPQGTLNALAQCGITNAEPSGSVGNFYGLTGDQLAPLAENADINVRSIGVSWNDLQNNVEGVIAEAEALGATYARFSGGRDFSTGSNWTLEQYAEVAEQMNEIGATLAEAGITLAYHNHGWEFEVQENGVTGYDVLLNETDPDFVAMELDVYWSASVGVDAADLFREYPGRFPLVHVKDMAEDGSFADVGEGVLDFQEMFALRDVAGIEWYFIEHDRPSPDGITSACNSYANLTTHPASAPLTDLGDALDGHVASGDVAGPIAHQLTNAVAQAERHLEGDRFTAAAAALENFLRHLDNPKNSDTLAGDVQDDLRDQATEVADIIG